MSPSNFLSSSLGSFTCVPKLHVYILEIHDVEGVKGVSDKIFPCDLEEVRELLKPSRRFQAM